MTGVDAPHPFDAMAAGYDAAFTASLIGRLMREAVWERLDAAFRPDDRILELGCGTGEDAVRLGRRGVRVLATDVSAGMLAAARAKVARAGLGALVQVEQLDIADLALAPEGDAAAGLGCFDGAFANFGGLNCVADQAGVARGLATLLRPGGHAILCVMGPLVPWEWGWYLRRGEPGRALRRLRAGGIAWRGITISYPSIRALERAYRPWFRLRRVAAVGALVPPSYAEPWAQAHPTALWALHRVERLIANVPPLPALADHYLIELQRA